MQQGFCRTWQIDSKIYVEMHWVNNRTDALKEGWVRTTCSIQHHYKGTVIRSEWYSRRYEQTKQLKIKDSPETSLHTYEHNIHDKGGMQSSEERKESLEKHAGETGYPYGKKQPDN